MTQRQTCSALFLYVPTVKTQDSVVDSVIKCFSSATCNGGWLRYRPCYFEILYQIRPYLTNPRIGFLGCSKVGQNLIHYLWKSANRCYPVACGRIRADDDDIYTYIIIYIGLVGVLHSRAKWYTIPCEKALPLQSATGQSNDRKLIAFQFHHTLFQTARSS